MTSMEPDGILIAAVLAGETDRFRELVDRYSAALWRLAKSRLGTKEAADDAVQETFLAAYRWLPSYDSRYSFRTWLWTIQLNECRRLLATRARRREVTTEADDAAGRLAALPGREAGPQQQALLHERAELLERLLRRLPEPQADALRLRFYGDLKFQEIADVLGCCLSTAKHRVRDGLLQLAQWLSEDDLPGNLLSAATDERDVS